MAAFNKVILIGHLTADPELKQSANGTHVTSFRIGVNRSRPDASGNRQTDYHTIVAWRQNADFVTRFFRKGRAICICGELQNRSYTDKDGTKRYVTEIVAEECNFVDSGSQSDTAPTAGKAAPEQTSTSASVPTGTPAAPAASSEPELVELADDEDLPF